LRPCLLEGFLVADPPLNQVVARTREAGLRGNINTAGGRGDWKLGLFRTDSESDIIQVASVLQGRGVFQNVPATRRQGLEAGAQYQTPQYLVYANYAFVDATYQFTGLLASPNNPLADENGNVLVTPGKQIPGIPRHLVKGGLDYFVTPQLKLGTDVIWVGSQWYVGDDANQNVKLADYWVANLHGSYQLTKEAQFTASSRTCSTGSSRHSGPISIRGRSSTCSRIRRPTPAPSRRRSRSRCMSACGRSCDEFQDRDHEADVADRHGYRCFRIDHHTCRCN
jgi:hypothetical protein